MPYTTDTPKKKSICTFIDMTEDDTFTALKRRPLMDVFKQYQRYGHHGANNEIAVYNLMTENGYTLRDYFDIYFDTVLAIRSDINKNLWIDMHMTSAFDTLRYTYGPDFKL